MSRQFLFMLAIYTVIFESYIFCGCKFSNFNFEVHFILMECILINKDENSWTELLPSLRNVHLKNYTIYST